MATENAQILVFGDKTTVSAVSLPVETSGSTPIANTAVEGLTNIGTATFSAYPLVPGTDVSHDTAAGVGAIAASDGVSAGELMKSGAVTGVSIAATGVVTSAVTFTNAFPAALDNVILTLRNPSAQTGAFGGVWTTSESATGFTINVDVTTAVAGGTVSVGYIAVGH